MIFCLFCLPKVFRISIPIPVENVARIGYFICYTTGLDNIAFQQLHSKLNSTYFSILNL